MLALSGHRWFLGDLLDPPPGTDSEWRGALWVGAKKMLELGKLLKRQTESNNSRGAIMSKVARITYNATGGLDFISYHQINAPMGTHSRNNTVGNEDKLFRSEWQMVGWRYAFFQSVHKYVPACSLHGKSPQTLTSIAK